LRGGGRERLAQASRERYMEEFIKRIEDAKTHLPEGHKDKDWMDGFNQGLEWAIRILNKDKSAY
jgi:hypothetical protein